ncbi:MAG: ABC transporter ATP-binding protein [Acidimicrobiia bacterium]
MSSLQLDNLYLSFGDGDEEVVALDHVTLTIEPGEMVAVVGVSGAGKSSLLAVAGALRSPASGTVSIAGNDITNAARPQQAQIRRDHIGFVFQSSNLFEALTAREQLIYAARVAGRTGASVAAEANELLAEVGLTDKSGRRPGQLSGGERQRVGIARALINQPTLLLVDEPTSALDHARAREIVELLREETHRRGIGTVLVTHDRSILDLADRVLTMRDGRIEASED